jgi:hypothetical protein
MQVVLTRRSKREERYEALELEFYSHTGRFRSALLAPTVWPGKRGF